ncbi:MAG: hypothetical protein O0V67_09980 [Methanocorpusculum sp.]|nr:hypothetical protein [Methanocorpusculum sp.]
MERILSLKQPNYQIPALLEHYMKERAFFRSNEKSGIYPFQKRKYQVPEEKPGCEYEGLSVCSPA